VQLVGQVSYLEALNWINKASVGLVALQPVTQYQGALPTKLLEYMAAGVPVVASNILPARYILKDFNCGILVEPSNPEQYAEAIISLLTHPKKAQQLGKNGHQAVLANYDWHREEEKLVSIYVGIQESQEMSRQRGVGMAIHDTIKG